MCMNYNYHYTHYGSANGPLLRVFTLFGFGVAGVVVVATTGGLLLLHILRPRTPVPGPFPSAHDSDIVGCFLLFFASSVLVFCSASVCLVAFVVVFFVAGLGLCNPSSSYSDSDDCFSDSDSVVSSDLGGGSGVVSPALALLWQCLHRRGFAIGKQSSCRWLLHPWPGMPSHL